MKLKALPTVVVLPLCCAALRSSGTGKLVEPEAAAKRVAIIGAGAGGSSAAYHLSKFALDSSIPTHIHVFERSSYIGGRTTTVDAWSDNHTPIELGGSIFVSVNHILVNASKHFGLSTASFDKPAPANTPELGVWNGKEFVVRTYKEDGWWDKAKLLWRYGLAPFRTNAAMKDTVGRFLSMYDEPLFPWKSLGDVVEKVGLLDIAGMTGEQLLKARGVGDLFAREIVQASTRVNYASNLGLIHGLETMVCMATNGAMAIEGGNWRIFAHMLEASSATTTYLNTTVTTISKQVDGTYNITTSSSTGETSTSTFDTVILAAPLQFSSLTIDPPPRHTPDKIPYVDLHVTLFATPHELDPTAFGLTPSEKVPQFILTTLPDGENHGSNPNGVGSPGFFSISIVSNGLNPHSSPKYRSEYIYKIFSAEKPSNGLFSRILGRTVELDNNDEGEGEGDGENVSWIYRKLWQSYPYEYPRVTFEEMDLDDGLWYTSGIESFISTMETSALMGKNVARLVVDGWVGGRGESESGKELGTSDGERLRVQGEEEWQFEGLKDGKQRPVVAGL